MEPAPFRFLTHAEFFSLSQADKASYLVIAVRELAKMTGILGGASKQEAGGAPRQLGASQPDFRSPPGPERRR